MGKNSADQWIICDIQSGHLSRSKHILSLGVFRKLSSESELNCDIILKAFAGSKLKPLWSVSLSCIADIVNKMIEFLVLSNNLWPLLDL